MGRYYLLISDLQRTTREILKLNPGISLTILLPMVKRNGTLYTFKNVYVLGCFFFKKEGHSRPLLIYFLLFNTVDNELEDKQMFNINFADDWSQTEVLWYRNQPLYQLSHNHFPALGCYEPDIFYGHPGFCFIYFWSFQTQIQFDNIQ